MTNKIALYLVRHGRTKLNEDNRFRGDADPPLDKNGYKDANEVAFWFSSIDVSFIVSSDKLRARTTADIISLQKKINQDPVSEFDYSPIYNELLRPWNIGNFGGMEKSPENLEALQKYVDCPDTAPPGGVSLSSFRARVRPLFEEAVNYGIEYGVPGILVVHSSVIHEAGETFAGSHEKSHVKPGGVSAVFINEYGHADIEPIFKPDPRSQTQNVLGVKSGHDPGLNS